MTDDQSINVKLKQRADRDHIYMYYHHPTTGKQVTNSTGQTSRDKALIVAREWQEELRAGNEPENTEISWEKFREEFEQLHLPDLREPSHPAYAAAMNHLERLMDPEKLKSITSRALNRFKAQLKQEGMKDTTLANRLRHLKAIISWGYQNSYIKEMPNFPTVKQAKGVKGRGRPINDEEFERMLLAAEKVRPSDSDKWKRLLTGLYLSGLRISDAMKVSWDYDAPFALVTTGRHPVFSIDATAQKAQRDEMVPLTPDFAAFVMETPESERKGWVFKMLGSEGKNMEAQHAARIIAKIGKRAGIVVDNREKKFASAHDLRRSFGTRWAKRNIPIAFLRKLMRHSNIQTTMEFYAIIDAQDLAGELWTNFGPGRVNPEPNREPLPISAPSAEQGGETQLPLQPTYQG